MHTEIVFFVSEHGIAIGKELQIGICHIKHINNEITEIYKQINNIGLNLKFNNNKIIIKRL